LTEHFQRSGDPRDIDKAFRYAELAATRALRVSAFGEAARHLRTALALHSGADSGALQKRCDLWLTLCHAMIGAGELEVRAARQRPVNNVCLIPDARPKAYG
jgi:hypothetical protein